MTSVRLSLQAKLDLEEISVFWRRTSAAQQSRVAAELKAAIRNIGDSPEIGIGQSALTLIYGEQVRSRLCGNYPFFYFTLRPIPEIFAILHTSRNLRKTLAKRAL